MLDAIVECLVKRKLTVKAYGARCAIICADVLAFIAMLAILLFAPALIALDLVIVVLAAVFTYLVFRNTDVEYEYSFFDGELAIDKVMHKMTRKKLRRFNMTKMDCMAPAGSQRLGGGVNNHIKYDYSTQYEDDSHFVAVVHCDDNTIAEVMFTPSEEMLEKIRQAYPRKVFLD
ncbi:MAG: hypothetical protein HDT13_06460 [Butyrivibrio sp.]|nr:hypothetical protein [Butyrivibrio sp.]